LVICCLMAFLAGGGDGLGSTGPIAASYGDSGLFCAIDASGKQAVMCWDAAGGNGLSSSSSSSSSSSALHDSTFLPAMAALSGGEGFMCGILADASQASCWDSANLAGASDLVPPEFAANSYSHVAAGKDHVCAVRGSYFADDDSGAVDCWDVVRGYNGSFLSSQRSNRFDDPNSGILVFGKLVSGDGFSCGSIRDGGIYCWGPTAAALGLPAAAASANFVGLASNLDSICGISAKNNQVQCWGNHPPPPSALRFVALSAGDRHFCGIREDDHGVECWGNFNSSLIPKGSGFLSIASSNSLTCGIRETDLILDCWFAAVSSSSMDFDPPLELCSPGLCTSGPCRQNMFSFNASLLNEPDLTNLCVRKDLVICSPCGLNCSVGYFPSSPCAADADRICTPCSLCQNSSCWDVCGFGSSSRLQKLHWDRLNQALIVMGSLGIVLVVVLSVWCFVINAEVVVKKMKKKRRKLLFLFCAQKEELKADANGDQLFPPATVVPCPGAAQVFRLSELKDATNGFKEFNELGRGSYGFVYKAVLADGRQIAVKRANAATIIRSNRRDFETELEILCNMRHANIVNLLGYCSEMGERLLVYEYMPHGTLYDHLHGGSRSAALNCWSLRFKIALQTARGIEYLHAGIAPPIVHHDVRSSKILLDSNWCARVSVALRERGDAVDMRADVRRFGVVLMEILTGRKVYDEECDPPNMVEWGLRYVREGNAGLIADRNVAPPKSFEPVVRFAEIAETAVCEAP
ncbi:hypothetical protein M569_16403, partial [Genlisea aurea]